MSVRLDLREQVASVRYLARWGLLSTPLGITVGSACAFFLWSLEVVTNWRFQQPWLLYLLPVAGVLIVWLYARYGKNSGAGNNLIIDEIHEPGGGIPFRMAPLVLLGTLLTHLCGGSAGREGTAVQIGGSFAGELARRWKLAPDDVSTLLMTGVAAGFAGVFGTPLAGVVFALEVPAFGRMNYRALLPCFLAAIISDQTCLAWGIGHTHYHVASVLPEGSLLHLAPLNGYWLAVIAGTGIACGLVGMLFAELAHGTQRLFQRLIPAPLSRPVVGGVLIIGMTWWLGTRDYLGLGVSSPDHDAVTILSCFHAGGAHPWSWWWKLVFTVITLGCGCKGGEVTPLFFIGAALGNTLAMLSGVPVDLMAAVGFVAVFAGATNTPLACTVMAVELFGGEYLLYYATGCLLAYQFSGHTGIYRSQRIGETKTPQATNPPAVMTKPWSGND